MAAALPVFAEDPNLRPTDDTKSYSHKTDEMDRKIDELTIQLSEQQDQIKKIKRQTEIYKEILANINATQSRGDECRKEMELLIELEGLSANDQDRADMSGLKLKHNARCPDYRL